MSTPVDQPAEPAAPSEAQPPLKRWQLFMLAVASQAMVYGTVLIALVVLAALDAPIWLVVIMLFIAFVPGLYFAMKINAYRRKRSGVDEKLAALDAWASQNGLTRANNRRVTLDVEASPFDLPGRHIAGNSWTGRYRDQGAAIFHYLVDTGTTKHPERRIYTVVAVTGNGDMPLTEAVPQRGVTRFAAVVGQDLDVESEDFNRAWKVGSQDVHATQTLLTPTVIERMVQQEPNAVRTLWSKGVIAVVVSGAVVDTGKLANWLDYVTDLAELVPGFVRTDASFTGAPARVEARAASEGKTKRERSNTEMILLVLALAALIGCGWVFRNVGPVAGGLVLAFGLLVAFRSTRIAAWIDRRRRR